MKVSIKSGKVCLEVDRGLVCTGFCLTFLCFSSNYELSLSLACGSMEYSVSQKVVPEPKKEDLLAGSCKRICYFFCGIS